MEQRKKCEFDDSLLLTNQKQKVSLLNFCRLNINGAILLICWSNE